MKCQQFEIHFSYCQFHLISIELNVWINDCSQLISLNCIKKCVLLLTVLCGINHNSQLIWIYFTCVRESCAGVEYIQAIMPCTHCLLSQCSTFTVCSINWEEICLCKHRLLNVRCHDQQTAAYSTLFHLFVQFEVFQ